MKYKGSQKILEGTHTNKFKDSTNLLTQNSSAPELTRIAKELLLAL